MPLVSRHALVAEALLANPPEPFPHFQLLPPTTEVRNGEACSIFVSALERVRQIYGLCVYGYVIMPEPVHLLVNGTERSTVAQAWKSLKQGGARRLALRAEEPFERERYYNFNVWSERKFREKVRYLHRNPVKRGFVA